MRETGNDFLAALKQSEHEGFGTLMLAAYLLNYTQYP